MGQWRQGALPHGLKSSCWERSHYVWLRTFIFLLVRENFEIVKRVSSELEYDEMGLSVHQVAISSSDVPSYVKFPTANGKSGIEKYGIHSLATNKKEVDFYEVKLTSVDKFVRDEGIVNVDILKIDTEEMIHLFYLVPYILFQL